MKKTIAICLALALLCFACFAAAETGDMTRQQTAELLEKEGVVPVTWEPSAEHLIIEGEEAQALYTRIVNGDYPSMEELEAHPVVAQIDRLSEYYTDLYGYTIEIPGRETLREEIRKEFLAIGSARTESIDLASGRHNYVYDGPLKAENRMTLVLGLPASGKSTRIVDPDSEAMSAFVLDPDFIKEELPEYKESHAAGADAVHFEGMNIFNEAVKAFTEGDMKGVNVILPIVSSDLNELMENYIRPFEAADYNVKVKFKEAKPNEAAARVIMRELRGGQLINSAVAFSFGDEPEAVYYELASMINSNGEPYGYEVEEALAPAA